MLVVFGFHGFDDDLAFLMQDLGTNLRSDLRILGKRARRPTMQENAAAKQRDCLLLSHYVMNLCIILYIQTSAKGEGHRDVCRGDGPFFLC